MLKEEMGNSVEIKKEEEESKETKLLQECEEELGILEARGEDVNSIFSGLIRAFNDRIS